MPVPNVDRSNQFFFRWFKYDILFFESSMTGSQSNPVVMASSVAACGGRRTYIHTLIGLLQDTSVAACEGLQSRAQPLYVSLPLRGTWTGEACKFKFKFNEAAPRGVPGPVFKKTPEMPGFTKMTPPCLPAGVRSLCTSTSPALHYQCQRLRL